MPLPANSRLGPYEIKSRSASAAWARSTRAHDSRLNRDVAIKVLREAMQAIPDLRNRFEREAHAVAALNHPNIVAVYDFGIEAQQYIVSELVEGESLRSLLTANLCRFASWFEIARRSPTVSPPPTPPAWSTAT